MASLTEILKSMEDIDREAQQKKQSLLTPLKEKLNEIRHQILELQKQEAETESALHALGENVKPRQRAAGATRKSNGPRVPSSQKRNVLAEFVQNGTIVANMDVTASLRTALKDRGFNQNDFRNLAALLPDGWTAISNGKRGLQAKTVIQRG